MNIIDVVSGNIVNNVVINHSLTFENRQSYGTADPFTIYFDKTCTYTMTIYDESDVTYSYISIDETNKEIVVSASTVNSDYPSEATTKPVW